MLPVKGPQKQDFLDIYLSTSFGVRKFENTSSMRVIFFFWKLLKLNLNLHKAKKIRKYFLLLT